MVVNNTLIISFIIEVFNENFKKQKMYFVWKARSWLIIGLTVFFSLQPFCSFLLLETALC